MEFLLRAKINNQLVLKNIAKLSFVFSRKASTHVVFFFCFAILPGRVIAVLLHQKASNEDSLWTNNRSRYEFVSPDEPIKCMLRESFLDE